MRQEEAREVHNEMKKKECEDKEDIWIKNKHEITMPSSSKCS